MSKNKDITINNSKLKTSLTLMGHPVSAETRLKISLKNKGRSHPMSEEAKRKISTHNSSKEFQNYQRELKRNNNSFNSSKTETESINILRGLFGSDDIITHYYSDLYPFECDVYIKSIDTFIEFNYHWTHGKHPFNPEDPNDIKKLNELKLKKQTRINSKGKLVDSFYVKLIDVWTNRDVMKLNTAKKNKLNYFTFYSIKIQ